MYHIWYFNDMLVRGGETAYLAEMEDFLLTHPAVAVEQGRCPEYFLPGSKLVATDFDCGEKLLVQSAGLGARDYVTSEGIRVMPAIDFLRTLV